MNARNIFLTVLLVVLLSPFLIVAAPQIIGGNGSYTVMSGSMGDALPVGSILITRHVEPGNINEGDIVLFEDGEDDYVTHRVIEIAEDNGTYQFTTKGDANENADLTPRSGSEVGGKKLLVIPYLGYITSQIRSDIGMIAFILLPALLLVGMQLGMLFRELRDDDERDWDEEAGRPTG